MSLVFISDAKISWQFSDAQSGDVRFQNVCNSIDPMKNKKLQFKFNENKNSSVHNACKLAYFGSGNGFALQQLCQ